MRATSFVSILVFLTAGCVAAPPDAAEDVDDGIAVPDGKADDFLSLTAREYIVEGRATVTLEAELADADEATKMERVHHLISLEQTAIAWFLNQYLVDKEHEESNANYGGFGAMSKNGSYEDMNITAVDGTTYAFDFRQIIAGRTDLLSRLPLMDGPDGTKQLVLTVGRPTNEEMERLETNHEWYRQSPWDGWNPATVPAEKKEDLLLTIRPETESHDAWFDYVSLFADDRLTIDVHFGWDYHSEYHIKHARALFTWLDEEQFFRAPVSSFDALTRTSGAFTRTIDVDGRDVTIEVRIYYGKPGSETDPDTDAGGRALEEDMRASLASSDVIVYSGHSGPFYGFALANWRRTEEGDFDDTEMRTVEMPADRYQIVVANGCDTYQIGAAFAANPNKPDLHNIDVITTTSFSNAGTPDSVEAIISRLTETDSRGRHRPRTVNALLEDLDGDGWGFHTMYGIHGIDDDPRGHPYHRLENLCAPCRVNADCGGLGNSCVGIGTTGRHCVYACTDDTGCPDGFSCKPLASQSSRTIYGNACVPNDFVCR